MTIYGHNCTNRMTDNESGITSVKVVKQTSLDNFVSHASNILDMLYVFLQNCRYTTQPNLYNFCYIDTYNYFC